MYSSWSEVMKEVECLWAGSNRFSSETMENVRVFVAFADGRYVVPNQVSEGIWPVISFHWSNEQQAIEIETHDAQYEFYKSLSDKMDILVFPRTRKESVPDDLVILLDTVLERVSFSGS